MARLLFQKLGIKDGMRLFTINSPSHYDELISGVNNIKIAEDPKNRADFIHLFAKTMKSLQEGIILGKSVMHKESIFWISWPKQSGSIKSEINREDVREIGIEEGLVDIKVASVDSDWSGLKFVIPLKNR